MKIQRQSRQIKEDARLIYEQSGVIEEQYDEIEKQYEESRLRVTEAYAREALGYLEEGDRMRGLTVDVMAYEEYRSEMDAKEQAADCDGRNWKRGCMPKPALRQIRRSQKTAGFWRR